MVKPVVERPELKYDHLRSENGGGTCTIGYRIDEETKTVFYTIARCAPFDNFCRKIGRDICAGRFAKGKGIKEFKYEKYDDIRAYFRAEHHPDIFVGALDVKSKNHSVSMYDEFYPNGV